HRCIVVGSRILRKASEHQHPVTGSIEDRGMIVAADGWRVGRDLFPPEVGTQIERPYVVPHVGQVAPHASGESTVNQHAIGARIVDGGMVASSVRTRYQWIEPSPMWDTA